MNERIGASTCPERDLLDPFAVRIVSFSVWLDYFPCYGRRNSLFWSLGNLPVSTWIPSVTGAQSGSLSPHFVKFPVNFPVSREFLLETASILTASATTQLRATGEFPSCVEMPAVGGVLFLVREVEKW